MGRVMSHKTHADKFTAIFKKLDAAIQDLQLAVLIMRDAAVVMSPEAAREAQQADSKKIEHLLGDIEERQGAMENRQVVIEEMVEMIDTFLGGSHLQMREDVGAVGDGVSAVAQGVNAVGDGVNAVVQDVTEIKGALEQLVRSLLARADPQPGGLHWQEHQDPWGIYLREITFTDPEEVLGRGSFGKVLSARFRSEPVAVKRIKLLTSHIRQRAPDEVALMFNLHHPNIVVFRGATFEQPDMCHIVMERLGRTMDDVVYKPELQLTDCKMRQLVVDVASGMV